MSGGLRAWLSEREPRPAFDLDPWLEGASSGADRPSSLSRLGSQALDRALEEPGRVRASALHLLAADALVTYACEAALEVDRPEDELDRILRGVSER